MIIVLQNQLNAAEKSADQLLLSNHADAMFCYNVQDLLRSIVELFGNLNRDVERWKTDASEPSGDAFDSFGDEWWELYNRLARICQKTAPLLKGVEANGHDVEGKMDFLKAWRELRGIVCMSREDVAKAAAEIERGEIRPLAQVFDELCGPSVNPGAE